MDTQRLILFFIFSFSLLLLWDAWQKEQQPMSVPAPTARAAPGVPTLAKPLSAAPAAPGTGAPAAAAVPGSPAGAAPSEKVQISTDLLVAEIDTLGATLSRLDLKKHKDAKDSSKNLTLLGPEHSYSAQSGLIGDGMPNHRTAWRALPGERALGSGAQTLQVRFVANGAPGVTVEKTYTFHRDSYLIDVAFELRNTGGQPIADRKSVV